MKKIILGLALIVGTQNALASIVNNKASQNPCQPIIADQATLDQCAQVVADVYNAHGAVASPNANSVRTQNLLLETCVRSIRGGSKAVPTGGVERSLGCNN